MVGSSPWRPHFETLEFSRAKLAPSLTDQLYLREVCDVMRDSSEVVEGLPSRSRIDRAPPGNTSMEF